MSQGLSLPFTVMMLVPLIVLGVTAAVAAHDPEGYVLLWEDNFNTFDTSKWEHEITAWGGGVSKI